MAHVLTYMVGISALSLPYPQICSGKWFMECKDGANYGQGKVLEACSGVCEVVLSNIERV